MYRYLTGTGLFGIALATTACGGGGGVHSAPPPPSSPPAVAPPPSTTPPPPSASEGLGTTAEFQMSNGTNHINVLPAWQSGASGQGVKIGFVDSGLNPSDPEFAGRVDPASRDVAGDRPMSDQYGHGTATASIAAAARNDHGIVGVAPAARIIMMKADNPGSCDGGCSYDHGNIAQAIRLASQAGAKVINLSLGGDGSSGIYDAVKEAAGRGTIFVVAAANDSNANPSEFARGIAAAAGGQAIIVGSMSENLSGLASFSNRAGSFENWYMTAPGQWVRAAHLNGLTEPYAGTSFSAPIVAGAAALLRQAFPNLSAAQVVQLLLTTADDLGATGVDSIYGYGMLNVGRAFQPVGQTSLAGTATAVSTSFNGSAPAAAGDALSRGSLDAVVLDSYARAFKVNLAKTVQAAQVDLPLARALMASTQSAGLQAAGMNLAVTISGNAAQAGFAAIDNAALRSPSSRLLAFSAISKLSKHRSIAFSKSVAASDLSLKLAGEANHPFMINEPMDTRSGVSATKRKALAFRQDVGGAVLNISGEKGEATKSYVSDKSAPYLLATTGLEKGIGNAWFGVNVTRLSESRSLLGARLSEALGDQGADTTFVDGRASWGFGRGWSLAGDMRRGWTSFSQGAFTTSAYMVQVAKRGITFANDQLTLAISQPLRVETGGLAMRLPLSYDYASETAKMGTSRLSLSPSSREIVSELGYERGFGSGRFGINLFVRQHPGHAAGAKADTGLALHLSKRL